MDQKGVSGRDLNQVGRDFIKKIFEINLANQNSSQINVFEQGGSEISSYLAAWENLDRDQRVHLVANFIKSSREIESSSFFYFNSYGRYEISFEKIFFTTLISFALFMQIPNNKRIVDKTFGVLEKYLITNSIQTYCLNVEPAVEPNENNEFAICKKYRGYKIQKSNDSISPTEMAFKDYENYKKSWLGQLTFWLLIPTILSLLISEVLKVPIRIIKMFTSGSEEKVRLEQKAREDAKKQTARSFFSLLNDDEKRHLGSLVSSYDLERLSLSINKSSTYNIYFHNAYNFEIEALISYLDLDQEWKTKGWYKIQPNSRTLMADTKNRIFYYCIRASVFNKVLVEGNDFFAAANQGEREYGLLMKKIDEGSTSGKWTLVIDESIAST